MAEFDLRAIDFRSDGVRDSLTESMSPSLFQENLQREFATAIRESRELTIASIVLSPENFGTVAQFHEALIAIAFTLSDGLRGGDFFARVSDAGFWVLLRTDEVGAANVIRRLDLPRHDDLKINLVARKYLNYSAWIEAMRSPESR